MKQINPTIARLDRSARRAGLDLRQDGLNKRTLDLGTRLLSWKPGGKGVIKVESSIMSESGATLDAVAHRTVEQMEALFIRVSYQPPHDPRRDLT